MAAKQPRLLVVDDEPDTCANLADIFHEFGYDVDVAYNGPDALMLVNNQAYDLALLDLKMPGMGGLELYRAIRRISSGTVAIIVTAYASRETAAAALDAGAWQVVPKPVDAADLLGLAGQALDQPLIMVVDDDDDLCQSLWDVFRQHGYRVCVAHDVPEALHRINQRDYRAVLVDMKLPQGSGDAILERIHEDCPTARTIIITGYVDDMGERIEKALADGADAVCYKPFDVEELLGTVNKLVSS